MYMWVCWLEYVGMLVGVCGYVGWGMWVCWLEHVVFHIGYVVFHIGYVVFNIGCSKSGVLSALNHCFEFVKICCF
jgi:hypothetical protein